LPAATARLEEEAKDIVAHGHVPEEHRRRLLGTHPLERLNIKLKPRSKVVGSFPNVRATIRLVEAMLLEQDHEWAVAERRYFSAESTDRLLAPLVASTDRGFLIAIA
jgi:putative transposase